MQLLQVFSSFFVTIFLTFRWFFKGFFTIFISFIVEFLWKMPENCFFSFLFFLTTTELWRFHNFDEDLCFSCWKSFSKLKFHKCLKLGEVEFFFLFLNIVVLRIFFQWNILRFFCTFFHRFFFKVCLVYLKDKLRKNWFFFQASFRVFFSSFIACILK